MKKESDFEIGALVRLGLAESHAKAYLALLENGAMTPAGIAEEIGEERVNGYKIAKKLIEMGLARQQTDKNKMIISAESPEKIKQLLAMRLEKVKQSGKAVNQILPNLMGRYRLTSNTPGVTMLDGVDGIKLVFDEINRVKKETLWLISSNMADGDVWEAMKKQVKTEHSEKVPSRNLVPMSRYDVLKRFETSKFRVRSMPDGVEFGSEIIIFGDNVVNMIFSEHGVVSMIISSPPMAETLRAAFELMWSVR